MEGCGAWLVSTGCNCVVDGKLLVELVRTSILELTTTGIEIKRRANLQSCL